MGAREFEAVLARLYVDASFRRRFLASPDEALSGRGLSEGEISALTRIDRAGLTLAAESYGRKRASRSTRPRTGKAEWGPGPETHRFATPLLSKTLMILHRLWRRATLPSADKNAHR